MKKSLLLLICCFVLSVPCFSQCETLFNTAMEYYNKGDYNSAKVYFNRVKENCGEWNGVSIKIQECENKLNGGNNPSKPSLSVGNSNVSFDPEGGTETVTVNSGEASWSFSKAPSWLNLSKSKGQLVIECEGNATGEERGAEITLFSGEGANRVTKKIQVTQSRSILSATPTSLNFSEHGGATYRIQVDSNDDWSVSAQSDYWFSVAKTDEGVSVSCDRNPSAMVRRGTFSLVTSNNESITINIKQDKSKPVLEIEESSLRVAWNAGDRRIKVNTNVPNWSVEVVSGASWCKVVKLNEQELLLRIDDNETGYAREVKFKVCAGGLSKDVVVTQRTLGYASIYEDYFVNMGGTKRKTPFSVGFIGGNWGVRASALMYRWKVVEINFLNLNASLTKSFQLRWEPMVRGYLPLQSDGRCWTGYVGVGRGVTFVDVPLKDDYSYEHIKTIIELGAECKLKLRNRDDISCRMFVRLDGYLSLGVAFDMFEWK